MCETVMYELNVPQSLIQWWIALSCKKKITPSLVKKTIVFVTTTMYMGNPGFQR